MKELYFFTFITVMSMVGVYKTYKEFSNKNTLEPDFFNVEVIDNRAQWVYNNKLYCGDIYNNSIKGKSAIEIDTFGMKPKDVEEMVRNFK
jgi:hypothetical protein